MSTKKRPTCYIIAGPNGAGKTTFALRYLPEIVACRNFINADEIASGLSPLNAENVLLPASKLFLKMIAEKITAREDFSFETTLSGRSYLSKIQQWRTSEWRVVLFYLYIPSVSFSALRVKQRVAQGGHNIPQEDIIRRYPRSISNLFDYMKVCDEVHCVDNSLGTVKSIFDYDENKIFVYDEKKFKIMKELYHEHR
ncbi:MAG: zeta toxin family protein [Victivallaceae bacterium]|nr:zeta toxin family protein [Victivallaceae bacterium]